MKFDSSKDINSQLPMPSGEGSSSPKTFDEVPAVVALFFRKHMGVGDTWFERVTSSSDSPVFLFGQGCSSGGSKPYQERWLDLIDAPILGYDEFEEDLSKVVPRNAIDFQSISFHSSRFPKDLRDALVLVAKKDLEVLKQWKEELLETNHSLNTFLSVSNKIEAIEKNSDLKSYLQPETPKKVIKMKP